MESLRTTPVECVKCGHEVVTDFDSIMRHDILECSNCGSKFHIFDVYDLYYAQEPLVKSGVDLILSYANQPWTIKEGRKGSSEAIKKLLADSNFSSLLETILHDVVLYGDSYLHIQRDPETKAIAQLVPLDAKAVTVKLGKEVHIGLAWTGEREIEGFVVTNGKTEKILTPADIIHSKSIVYTDPYAPYGESIIRINLKSIHYLRTTRAPALAQGTSWWINYLEDEICLGMGVPRFLFEKGYIRYGKRNIEFASTLFVAHVRDALRAVADAFRSQLFGQALGIQDFHELPSIKFKGFDSFRLLRDGGYDFAEEIKGFKQLYQTGIISKEEYEESIAKFLGKE